MLAEIIELRDVVPGIYGRRLGGLDGAASFQQLQRFCAGALAKWGVLAPQLLAQRHGHFPLMVQGSWTHSEPSSFAPGPRPRMLVSLTGARLHAG